MTPLLATVISQVATKFVDHAADDEYNKSKKLLFPKKTYINQLVIVINEAIAEFEQADTRKYPSGKFPFYNSQVLFEELSKYVLLKTELSANLIASFQTNPHIAIPTEKELSSFYELLTAKIKSDSILKDLYINENFKVEIYNISEAITKLISATQDIQEKVTALIHNLNPSDKPVLVDNYLKRLEEDKLWKIIEANNVLLLTGLSFCGKSQTAKNLANRLVKNGYKYSSRSDVNEAERFLRNSTEPKVFILEDPFGHNSENTTNWRSVQELIRNLNSTSKLIVTSRLEILKSVNSTSNINECAIDGNSWNDLTSSDIGFLINAWNDLCKKKNIPDDCERLIATYLETQSLVENILQVGQLNHLSNIPLNDLKNKSIEELLHFARADAKEISLEIQKRGAKTCEIFTILGLGATTNIQITFNELGYILNKNKLQLSYIEREDKISIRGRRSNGSDYDKVQFPAYPDGLKIKSDYLKELSFLQKRGFIEISNKSIWFVHPTYREAARYLLLINTIETISIIDRTVKKLFSCLNPETIINCVKQFNFIYNNSKSLELQQSLRLHALKGMQRSMFPGVRDSCFTFLLLVIDDLQKNAKEKILNRLNWSF